jgi:hypothetical protein
MPEYPLAIPRGQALFARDGLPYPVARVHYKQRLREGNIYYFWIEWEDGYFDWQIGSRMSPELTVRLMWVFSHAPSSPPP